MNQLNQTRKYSNYDLPGWFFGLRPSPAILGSTICHHLDTQTDSNPQQVELLKNSLYVDDFVSGADDEEQALELSSNAKSIMQRGAFNLRKWHSNSSYVQEKLSNDKLDHVAHSSPAVNPVSEKKESYAKTVTGPSTNAKKGQHSKGSWLNLEYNIRSTRIQLLRSCQSSSLPS